MSAVNLSTTLTSNNFLSMSGNGEKSPERTQLDSDMKHKLCYFIKHFSPILSSAMIVANDLVPQITQLQQICEAE